MTQLAASYYFSKQESEFMFYSEKPAMPDNVLSLNELRKLDLNDQIRALLINGKLCCCFYKSFVLITNLFIKMFETLSRFSMYFNLFLIDS